MTRSNTGSLFCINRQLVDALKQLVVQIVLGNGRRRGIHWICQELCREIRRAFCNRFAVKFADQ